MSYNEKVRSHSVTFHILFAIFLADKDVKEATIIFIKLNPEKHVEFLTFLSQARYQVLRKCSKN